MTGAPHDPDVADDPVGGEVHRPAAPVRGGQGQGGGVGPRREEQAGVGAPKGLRGGIGVPEHHEVDRTRADDGVEQAGRGRRQLLGVVDDDEAQRRPQAAEGVGVGLQVVRGGAQDPRRVESARRGRGP